MYQETVVMKSLEATEDQRDRSWAEHWRYGWHPKALVQSVKDNVTLARKHPTGQIRNLKLYDGSWITAQV